MEITKEQFSGLQEVDSILESIFTNGENSVLLVIFTITSFFLKNFLNF